MTLPLNKRDFDVFLSHAHKDVGLVRTLDAWLSDQAGFRVWLDSRELSGGAMLATDLQAAIGRCRALLLVASGESVEQGWVKNEYNSAMDERARHDGFRVVALRMADANVDSLMRGISWIDMPAPALDRDTAFSVLRAFYPGENRPDPATARDVYVSCSWRAADRASALAVCKALVERGFRLIGDAKDQKGFGQGERVERIIASCGAFVGIVPYRGAEEASAADKPYKYFVREMDCAAAYGLPCTVIADPRVQRTDGPADGWLAMDTESDTCPGAVEAALDDLWDEWRPAPKPQYVFCALDLDSDAARRAGPIRHLIERVTGMPTIVGNEIHEEPLHAALIQRLRDAFLVLADITDDNVNACIEAGMGLAAGANVELLARGEPRRPPFMLRSLQMDAYADDIEQAGVVHRIVRPYRRRVINAEL